MLKPFSRKLPEKDMSFDNLIVSGILRIARKENMLTSPVLYEKTSMISLQIDHDLLQKLNDFRWKHRVSRSEAVREAINQYLSQFEK